MVTEITVYMADCWRNGWIFAEGVYWSCSGTSQYRKSDIVMAYTNNARCPGEGEEHTIRKGETAQFMGGYQAELLLARKQSYI